MRYFKFSFLNLALCFSLISYMSAMFEREVELESLRTDIEYAQALNAPVVIPDNLNPDFKIGFAICEYQNSGQDNCPNTNWADWENSRFSNNEPHIKNGQVSGVSCDFWNNYKTDIKLMQELGVNSLRFSLAWDRIEPNQGEFDQEALEHYDDVIDTLLEAGIKPLITLHHFVHPRWFEELGGFENEENIKYIVRFAKRVFKRYSDRVNLWCTINEPNIFTLQGYIREAFPPGKNSIYTGLKVLRNLLKAHTDIYIKLKNLPNGQKSKIGFIHQYLKFQAYRNWNLIEHIPGFVLNYILNYLTLNFLKTGKFTFPTLSYTSPLERPLDYIGLNYYSRVLLQTQFSLKEPIKATCYPDEIMTDMPYPIYPKGLYDAIMDVASLNVPIYITENGIADQKDDRRDLFLRGYMNAMFDAIKDGADVRGYYYWTFTDNFEWDEGFLMKFGLFEVDFVNQERTLRGGAQYFKGIIEKINNFDKDN